MKTNQILDKSALAISRLFHPFLVGIPLGLLYLFHAGLSFHESARWVSIAAVVGLVPVALFLKFHPDYNLRKVNPREKRNLLYFFVLGEIIFLAAVFRFLSAPHSVLVAVYTVIAAIPIGGAVNHYTKISVHTSVLSGFSTALLFVSTLAGLAGFAATVLTAWSRIRLERHTPTQVALGILMPLIVVGATFTLLF